MRYAALQFAILFVLPAFAIAQPSKPLKEVLQLSIPREGGANGASVAWHPIEKKYYAAMAGNSEFCMGIYDAKGKRLSDIEQKTFFDVRGLWYNADSKTLQANGYDDMGWIEYKLNTKGFPTATQPLHPGMNQPDGQCVGAYNNKEKVVYFFNVDGSIEIYNHETASFTEIVELSLGKTKENKDFDNEYLIEGYNSTTAVYTGIIGAEIGLLNHIENQIELYNIKTGYLTRVFTLPALAPSPKYLNFSYCNGIYWLFDTKTRIWKGYR